MIDKFLKAKHWQLFLLTFAIPMIFQFVAMGLMISNFATQRNPNPVEIFSYMKIFPLIMILSMGTLFGWYWSVAIGLQTRVPEHVTMKVKKFKIFFFIPMIYMISLMIVFIFLFTGLSQSGDVANVGLMGGLFAVIFPIHLFSMFCIFYSLYFVAKTFKTVELQREVTFGDFAGEFFLIWFYPIGVWIVQPKINKMMEQQISYTDNNADL